MAGSVEKCLKIGMSHPSEWTCFANSTDGRNVWQNTVFLNVSDGHPIVSIIIAVVFGVSAVVGILLTVLVAFWLKKRRTLTEPDAESQPDTPRQAPPAPFLQSPESRQDPSVESLEMMPVRGAASDSPHHRTLWKQLPLYLHRKSRVRQKLSKGQARR